MRQNRVEYRSHRIEVRLPEPEPEPAPAEGRRRRPDATPPEAPAPPEPELLIDDEPVPSRVMPDGTYVLEAYAYDPQDDLVELARRFIDYRERADATLRRAAEGGNPEGA